MAPASSSSSYVLKMVLTSSTLDAASGQTVIARVWATTAGYPQIGVTVTFSSTGDVQFSSKSCTTGSKGLCMVTISPGSAYGVQTITANGTGAAGVWHAVTSGTLTQYSAPSTMTLSLSRTAMVADGAATSMLTVTVLDASGRGVAGEPLQLSLGLPDLAPEVLADQGDGTYVAAIEPPTDAEPGTAAYADSVNVTLPEPLMTAAGSVTLTNPTPRLAGPLTAATSATGSGEVFDASGAPVQLQGVDIRMDSYPYFGDYTVDDYPPPSNPAAEVSPVADREIGTAYEWGANYVRLMLSSDLWLNSNRQGPCQSSPSGKSGYDPAYQQLVGDAIRLITSYGMLAVLDLQTTNPNCSATSPVDGWALAGGLPSGRYPLPSLADAGGFWSQVASAFGGNPLVAFEPFNEPQVCGTGPGSTQVIADNALGGCKAMGGYSPSQASTEAWVRGGSLVVASSNGQGTPKEANRATTYVGAGMAFMVRTIRAAAPDNLLFLDANHWAWDGSVFDLMGAFGLTPTNAVYTFHYYDCQGTSGGTVSCESAAPERCYVIAGRVHVINRDPVTGAPWSAPVVVDEFGWPENASKGSSGGTTFTLYQHGLFMQNVIATLQAAGDGWSAFDYYSTKAPGGAYAIATAGPTGPWTPTADGAPVAAAMGGGQLSCTNPPSGYG